MTYRLRDDLGYGDEYGSSAGDELTAEDAAALPRRGRHSANASGGDGPPGYAYERPPTAPRRSVPRHAAPSYDEIATASEADAEPIPSQRRSSVSRWTPSTEWETAAYDRPGGYLTPPTPRDRPGEYEYDTGPEYDRGPEYGTVPEYDRGPDATVPLAALGGGLVTEVRPRYAPAPPGPRPSPDAETEVLGAIGDTVEGSPHDVAPAEAPVPIAAPATGGRLGFLGKKHVGLRLAAVSVLVVGAAIGITVGVLADSNPDTVKVTDDIQADPANTTAPTTNSNADRTPTPSAADQQLIEQQQQEMVDKAQDLAASKAADAQSAAAATAQRASKARASRGTTGAPVPTAPVDCNTYSGNKATGCALLAEYDFETTQMTCLDKLWTKESHWTTTAENSSGAYGIPQALPGSKMSSVADDWRTNPATQIRWGLGYIKGKYGTPCDAWATSEATGSY